MNERLATKTNKKGINKGSEGCSRGMPPFGIKINWYVYDYKTI